MPLLLTPMTYPLVCSPSVYAFTSFSLLMFPLLLLFILLPFLLMLFLIYGPPLPFCLLYFSIQAALTL